jgi:hypothetical protein
MVKRSMTYMERGVHRLPSSDEYNMPLRTSGGLSLSIPTDNNMAGLVLSDEST